ncbi:MAG: HlyD family efflux transporter periplasmic adaptor subunit [Planctomycetaceae bacterium]|nr:HlyD family efflux transporter periplasmic adaptor subunit [Planctomycetaceae bacterium]
MNTPTIIDFSECTEFGQTLDRRPTLFVHLVIGLMILLVASVIGWAAYTKVNLIVVAHGRVRPEETPTRVFASVPAGLEGRVADALVAEGDEVHSGDVLLRLDTGSLDNDIEKLERRIDAATQELEKLEQIETLLVDQHQADDERINAELQAEQDRVSASEQRRDNDVRQAELAVEQALENERRIVRLVRVKAETESKLLEAVFATKSARETLKNAQLPVDQGRLEVLKQERQLAKRKLDVEQGELDVRRINKQGEAEAARKELANLHLQREQAVIVSPVDGVVIAGELSAGDLVKSGEVVFEVAEQQGFIFEAGVPGDEIADLKADMPSRIKFDAFDHQQYGTASGTVTFVSPDSQVSDDLVVYNVKIALADHSLRRGDRIGQIRLGLAGRAEIITQQKSLLAVFGEQIRHTISF